MKEDFYKSNLVSSTYNMLTDVARQHSGDLEFYEGCAHRWGSPVLELGVGTGRVAWKLAEAGHQIVGVDLSTSMLDRARERGSSLPAFTRELVKLVHGDMTNFSLDTRFPLAFILFSTLNHLTDPADQRLCLNNVRRHLNPGGRLVIDMFDPILDACAESTVSPNPPLVAMDPQTGHKVHRRSISRVNHPLSQSFTETFRVERVDAEGKVIVFEEPVHHLRWATRQEMMYLFELTGFEVESSYGDFKMGRPFYGGRQVWVLKSN